MSSKVGFRKKWVNICLLIAIAALTAACVVMNFMDTEYGLLANFKDVGRFAKLQFLLSTFMPLTVGTAIVLSSLFLNKKAAWSVMIVGLIIAAFLLIPGPINARAGTFAAGWVFFFGAALAAVIFAAMLGSGKPTLRAVGKIGIPIALIAFFAVIVTFGGIISGLNVSTGETQGQPCLIFNNAYYATDYWNILSDGGVTSASEFFKVISDAVGEGASGGIEGFFILQPLYRLVSFVLMGTLFVCGVCLVFGRTRGAKLIAGIAVGLAAFAAVLGIIYEVLCYTIDNVVFIVNISLVCTDICFVLMCIMLFAALPEREGGTKKNRRKRG